jgi:desulfoferrodoxin (superoxide reductase-like protein)
MEQKHHKLTSWIKLIVKKGDIVKTDQALNVDPNVVDLVKKNLKLYYKIRSNFGYLAFCFAVLVITNYFSIKEKTI